MGRRGGRRRPSIEDSIADLEKLDMRAVYWVVTEGVRLPLRLGERVMAARLMRERGHDCAVTAERLQVSERSVMRYLRGAPPMSDNGGMLSG